MTGFGSAETQGYRIEVRSVNHKFLDVHMRAPAFLAQLEILFRGILREHFSRGKFDITVTVSEHASTELSINPELVRKIYEAFRELQDDLSIRGDIDINTIVNLHGMFIETSQKFDLDAVTEVFKQSLKDLQGMRTREGEALSGELMSMCNALGSMNDRVGKLCGRAVSDIQLKFSERLKVLMEGSEIDSSRILQEAAITAARLDISEEISRVESHIGQFRETLAKGGIIGRKLDFILQELNREVNTIASKSADYELSSLTVDMKTEIEKIREQVQNIQ